MPWKWISHNDIRVIAIVGICKNAGKTSLLNAILRSYPKEQFGVLSTGIDGEDTDTVFNIPKPKLQLPAKCLFCCDSGTLDAHGSNIRVMAAVAADNTRPLWIARALLPLSTQITGPATVSGQIALCRQLQDMGAHKVLVDGSLDRKSIALSDAVDAVAMVLGASFGNTSAVINETRRLLMLAELPVYQAEADEYTALLNAGTILVKVEGEWMESGITSLIDSSTHADKESIRADASSIFIPGAITDSVWKARRGALLAMKAQLILRHPDCLKLSFNELQNCVEKLGPTALIPFRLRGFALNSTSPQAGNPDAGQYRQAIREAFPQIRIIDIMELDDAG